MSVQNADGARAKEPHTTLTPATAVTSTNEIQAAPRADTPLPPQLPAGRPKAKRGRLRKNPDLPGKTIQTNRQSVEQRALRRRTIPISTDNTLHNNSYCDVCFGGGRFVCCDACPRSFHFACLEPPLEMFEVPSDNWYCKSCQSSMTRPPPRSGLFGPLMHRFDVNNPVVFSIPRPLIEEFANVGVGPNGEYIDTSELKKEKFNGRTGFVMEPDYSRVKDETGQLILCYKCRFSALHGKMIQCDYCQLYWHWDCLDPPMVWPPPSTRRWMCPNHAQHVMLKIRKFKDFKYIEPPGPFVSNNVDVEILLDSRGAEEEEEMVVNGVTHLLPGWSLKLRFLEEMLRSQRTSPTSDTPDVTARMSATSSPNPAGCAKNSPNPAGCATNSPNPASCATNSPNPVGGSTTPGCSGKDGNVGNWLLALATFEQKLSCFLAEKAPYIPPAPHNAVEDGLEMLFEAAKLCDSGSRSNVNGYAGVVDASTPHTSSRSGRRNSVGDRPAFADDPDYPAFLEFKELLKVHGEFKVREMLGFPCEDTILRTGNRVQNFCHYA